MPLPTVPLPDDQAAAPTPAPDGTREPEPPLDTSLSHCGLQERAAEIALIDPAATVTRTAEDEGTARFGAEPGALGRGRLRHGVGQGGDPGGGRARRGRSPGSAAADRPRRARRGAEGCPLTLVSLDQLTDAGQPGVDRTDLGTEPEARAAALLRIDRAVGELRAAVGRCPGTRCSCWPGSPRSTTADRSCTSGWPRARLRLLRLADLGQHRPGALRPAHRRGADRPARAGPGPAGVDERPADAGERERPALARAVQELEWVNTAATVHHRNTGLLLLDAGDRLGGAGRPRRAGARRARRQPAGPRAGRRPADLAVVAAALPVATYLAGLVPWERSGSPVLALVAAVVAADLVVAAIALLGPWRRRRLGPPWRSSS